jgi:hypothetical protein
MSPTTSNVAWIKLLAFMQVLQRVQAYGCELHSTMMDVSIDIHHTTVPYVERAGLELLRLATVCDSAPLHARLGRS